MDLQKRSHAGLLTIGILQITLGILGLLCGLIAVSGATEAFAKQQSTAPGQLSQAEIQQIIEEYIPHQKIFQGLNSGLDLLLSILMIASGIGLVRMNAWGRTVANVYGISSILFHIYSLIFSIVFLIPAMDAVGAKMATTSAPGAAMGPAIMKATSVLTAILTAVFTLYPITVLCVVNRKNARATLSGIPTDSFNVPQDYYDQPENRASGPLDEGYRQAPDDRYGPS